jgi:GNAT superfamily N-acetyltransferase
MLGLLNAEGGLLAAALVTLPGTRPPPAELAELREQVWQQLGPGARARYETFASAAPITIEHPHHHLNMIGVDPPHAGRGLARVLLDHIHALAGEDDGSTGVSLSTEVEANLALYLHFDYRLIGYARVSPDLETWTFFRPSPGPA